MLTPPSKSSPTLTPLPLSSTIQTWWTVTVMSSAMQRRSRPSCWSPARYYDLEKKRAADGRDDIAIVRIEMLHPIPFNRLRDAFESYPNATQVRFVQDEPANQGPWPFYNEHLRDLIPDMPEMVRVSRRSQSSTATGIAKVHQLEQKNLLDEAFDI